MVSRDTQGLNSADLDDRSTGRIGRALRFVRQRGVLEPIRLVRKYGVAQSGRFVARNIRHIVADRLAREWDRDNGVDTAGSIRLDTLDVVGPHRDQGNECVCTSPKSFSFIMKSLPLDLGGYTFIDIGSGKSRTLLLASHYPFAAIVGVEFAKELVEIARRNIAKYKSPGQKCRAITVIEADATTYEFPESPLLVYFYNPFSKDVFDVVMSNLASSLEQRRRGCFVVYGSSSHSAIDWARPAIRERGIFEELAVPAMPHFLDAVRTIDYAVFRYQPPIEGSGHKSDDAH
jgi:predicted RNA methylase